MLTKKIVFPSYIEVRKKVQNHKVFILIKSKKACFSYLLPVALKARVAGNTVTLFVTDKKVFSLLQVYKKRIENDLKGILEGHIFDVEIRGSGSSFYLKENAVFVKAGAGHLFYFSVPKNVKVFSKTPATPSFSLKGYDLPLLTNFIASLSKSVKKDPYKGSGIFLVGDKPILKKSKKEKD